MSGLRFFLSRAALVCLALINLFACASDLQSGAYRCELNQPGNCPSGWYCQCRGAGCEARCYETSEGYCGDGVFDPGEECDGVQLADDANCASGFPFCRVDCRLACTECGNGVIEATSSGLREQCDDGNGLSHDGCSSDCFAETPLPPGTLPEPEAFPEGWSSIRSARFGHAMAYDAARARMVLFGGRAHRSEVEDVFLGDTWEWDGEAWVRVTGAGPGPASSTQDMTYNSARKRVVLVSNGIWEWTNTSWARLPVAAGSPELEDGQIAYDSARDRLVLLDRGKTWEWEGASKMWRDVTPAGGAPAPSGGVLVYDPSVGRTVCFGDGIWEWDGRAWAQVSSQLTAMTEVGKDIAYDTNLRRIIGTATGNGVWTWDSRTHTLAQAPALPDDEIDRRGAALAHHGGRTILVGGIYSASVYELTATGWEHLNAPVLTLPGGPYLKLLDERKAQTWALGLGSETRNWLSRDRAWTPAPASALRPAAEGPAMFDFHRNSVVMIVDPGAAQETWEWNGTAWARTLTTMTPALGQKLLYDSSRKRVLNIATPYLETRMWTGSAWQAISSFEEWRMFASMVYDRVRGRIVHFGGYRFDRLTAEVLELQGQQWMKIPSSGPAPAEWPSLWFDPDRQRTIYNAGEIWEWDGARWSEVTQGTALVHGPPAPLAQPPFSTRATASLTGEVGPASTSVLPLRFTNALAREETCRSGFDTDADGFIGCADPDCWRVCSPACSPGQACPPDAPRCGDGICNGYLEDCRLCPSDCGACPLVCGDFLCDAGETAAMCPGDC